MGKRRTYELTKKRQQAYLECPEMCPFCGSEELTAERFDQSSSNEVYRRVTCNACQGEFMEVFTLSGVERWGE